MSDAAALLAGRGLQELFGSDHSGPPLSLLGQQIRTPNFKLRTQISPTSGTNTTIERVDTPELRRRLGLRADALSQIGANLGEINSLPDVTQQIVDNAFSRERSNLRDAQSRRRVAGSSFANQELASLASEQALVGSRVKRETTLEKVASASEQIKLREGLLQQEVAEELSLLEVATGVTRSVSSAVADHAMLQTKLAAEAAAAEGEFYGSLGQALVNPFSGGIDEWFGNLMGP